MRKLVGSTFVTLDGVIGNPQDWNPPYWDDEFQAYADGVLGASDAVLLGRKTYESFAVAWPPRAGDAFADRLNSMPKYVASTTLSETSWNASLIEGDVAESVAELKQQPGQNIVKFGTGELDRTLLDHGLIDEFYFWRMPAIVGSGERLLDGIETRHLKLLDTTIFDSGVIVNVYNPKS